MLHLVLAPVCVRHRGVGREDGCLVKAKRTDARAEGTEWAAAQDESIRNVLEEINDHFQGRNALIG